MKIEVRYTDHRCPPWCFEMNQWKCFAGGEKNRCEIRVSQPQCPVETGILKRLYSDLSASTFICQVSLSEFDLGGAFPHSHGDRGEIRSICVQWFI